MKTIKGVIIRAFIIGTSALLLASAVHVLAQDAPQFSAISLTDEGALRLAWTSTNHEVYQIQYANELNGNDDGSTAWQVLYDNYPSQGTNTFWLDTGNYFEVPAILHPKKMPMRFYRIVDKGPDDLASDEPTVSIVSPTNGLIVSGLLTVAVAASTDQGIVHHKLYVDGQEMWLSPDGTNYVINTCEWGNGPHVLFATASSSTAVDGPATSFGLAGHAVSPFVGVTFSNLITRISFSEEFFEPSLGQTQQVSAVFAANVDWTLQIRDVYSNLVRTVTGSGTSMAFNWDGNGDGGTNLPAGVYYHYISAQTNGQSFSSDSSQGSGSESGASLLLSGGIMDLAAAESSDTWYPTSPKEALAAGLTSYFLQPIPMPPIRIRTNGVWTYVPYEDVYGPQSLIEVPVPLRMQERFLQSLSTGGAMNATSLSSMDSPSGSGYGGASVQSSPPAPLREPTPPCRGSVGKFGIAYQMYNANGTNPVYAATLINGGGVPGHIQIANSLGLGANQQIPFAPFHNVDLLALNFSSEMYKGCWSRGFLKHDDDLHLSDLQGSGTPFNDVDIGLLILHGAYGTSFDYSTGHQFKGIYFPIASGGSAQYLRMSETSLGGSSPTNGLKWMAIMACTSLYQANWNSMKNQGVKPYNSNLHMILGTATEFGAEPIIGQYWADYMLGDPSTNRAPMKIRDAWYAAGRQAYQQVYQDVGLPYPTEFAVAADDNCSEDSLQTNSVPSGGTWNYYLKNQVYP